jgi:hypothetical protein
VSSQALEGQASALEKLAGEAPKAMGNCTREGCTGNVIQITKLDGGKYEQCSTCFEMAGGSAAQEPGTYESVMGRTRGDWRLQAKTDRTVLETERN